MRYTSEATMDERALRDVERWKDKIEVRLDNRQVFFLFFGSALVACLLFVLGVIVGKRLESRGKAVAPEIEDPLALLDKVAATPRALPESVGVGKALFGAAAPIVKPPAELPAKPAAEVTVKAPPPSAAKPDAPAPKASIAVAPMPVEVAPNAAEPVPNRPVEVAPKAVEPVPKAAEALPKPPETVLNDATRARLRFALQIGSFPAQAEAEAFAHRFAGAYVVESDIPGKGIWFRVRVGEYGSTKEAIGAKAAFEKKHGVIALVGPASAAPVAAKTSTAR